MPLVKVDEVASFVIADERTQEHLRRSESARSRMGFRDFCTHFGIHDIGELNECQLFALVAARNTAGIIDLLQIPCGKQSSGKDERSAYDLHRRKTTIGPAISSFLASVPDTEQEYEVLRDPEDIPQAIPEDLLLRRLAPKEFLRRLAEGELLRSAWIQRDLDDLLHAPTEAPEQSKERQQDSDRGDKRPFGYLLLDASESMGTGRDRRDEVARGLALAFLRSQYESGNPTYLFLFSHQLSPPFGGESRMSFESAVAAILAHPHEGMTNLQGSLKLLAERILAQKERIDIALITDGVTRMTENPVKEAHLHTFLVGVTPEELDQFAQQQYHDSLTKLSHWSDFLFRIEPSVMSTASIPRREDVLDVAKILYGVKDDLEHLGTAAMCRRVYSRVWNVMQMIVRYREANSAPDAQIDEIFKNAKDIHANLCCSDPDQIAFDNLSHWTSVDRDMTLAIEKRELKTIFDKQQSEGTVSVIDRSSVASANIFEALMILIQALKRLVRRRRRRLL